MGMSIRVRSVDWFTHDMELRFPFEFGNVTVTERPLLVGQVTADVDGKRLDGYVSDTMLPNWFIKDTPYREAFDAMTAVIRAAADHAVSLARTESVFEFYENLYEKQRQWANDQPYPPLLWGFGVSLVERGLIGAFCRARDQSFSDAVRNNALGIDLGSIYPTLQSRSPSELLPSTARRSVAVRHTVGHSDPLTSAELGPESEDDGLPRSLSEYVQTDGVSHFKIKLGGTPDSDVERVTEVLDVVESLLDEKYAFTVDANEQYRSVEFLREFWDLLRRVSGSREERLLAIEQPFSRETAFTGDTCASLQSWDSKPPVIIDESDEELDSLATALECGYDGTSHKNCKGVFKSIANACLIAHYDRVGEGKYLVTAEDLMNVGPVALLQDLAVVATLGIDHVERNGHHYFRGLDTLPAALQRQTLSAHGDLYRKHEGGFPTLDVRDGVLSLDSIVDAPFGVEFEPNLERFTRLERR